MQDANDNLRTFLPPEFQGTLGRMPYYWNVNSVTQSRSAIHVQGWALPIAGKLNNTEILLGTERPRHIEWSEESKVAELYPYWPNARWSSFRAEYRKVPPLTDNEGSVVVRVMDLGTLAPLPESVNFYYPLQSRNQIHVPDSSLLGHIGGGGESFFLLAGNTLYRQFDRVFRSLRDRAMADVDAILDWGCGTGRILQHIPEGPASATRVGVDIDSSAISWCSEHIPRWRFVVGGLHPPLPFEDGTFEVVYAYSVFTHLRASVAHEWWHELRRILRPGGMLLFTLLGPAAALHSFGYTSARILEKMTRKGFYDGGKNDNLDGAITDDSYYRNTWLTREYIGSKTKDLFRLVSYQECFHFYQDLAVLQCI